MRKDIPIYFDNAVIMAPPKPITPTSDINRLKVGVFTKYGNQNGSYITDGIADMLINGVINRPTPVVGFFDNDTHTWAGHTGPKTANGYGYVEGFDGWQPFQDKDGITRDYAVFSVALFTNYYNAANFVVGQNQSMELDINSIEGDWVTIEGKEYFVYTRAEIMGLCIIGNHSPCFSVSTFFSKNDDRYTSQYEKFSSLLADLKAKVEEAEKQPIEGGEHQMQNGMNPEVNEPTPAQDFEQEPAAQEPVAPTEPAAEPVVEPVAEPTAEEPVAEPVAEPAGEPAAEPTGEPEGEPAGTEPEPAAEPEPAVDFEAQIAELQSQLTEMTTNYENARNRIAELEAQISSAFELETNLRNEIATYEAERTRLEVEKKSALIDQYAADLTEEEINPIRAEMGNFSLNELESKLAVCYAKKHMAGSANNPVVPLPEPVVDEFAAFMEKYRKN